MIKEKENRWTKMQEKDFEEKTLHRETIYDGKILKVVVDDVLLPNQQTSKREIVLHNGAVGILAITPDEKMIFVRQYRKALEKTLLEIPAGKIEKGEKEPLAVAKRELEEETDFQAENWTFMYDLIVAPGYSSEKIYLYKATGLTRAANPLEQDEDECLELSYLTLEEAKEAIVQGEIQDAKTICAIQYWELHQK